MTHSTRNSYKDKAMAAGKYKQALEHSLTAIRGLNNELALRAERERELLDCITALVPIAKNLSGNLRGCAGDFGVGVTIPNDSVDHQLAECRPAVIIQRAAVLMNLANMRLEVLHTEATDAEVISEELLDELAQLEINAKGSIDRRRRLLITGDNLTETDVRELDRRSNEYVYDKSNVDLKEIYTIESEDDIETSEDDEEYEGSGSKDVRGDMRKAYERKFGKKFH